MFGIGRYRLRVGFREYLFLGSRDPIPAGHEPLSLSGRQAEGWLGDFSHDASSFYQLRALLEQVSLAPISGPLQPEQIVRRLASLLEDGHLRVVRAPERLISGDALSPEPPKAKAEESPAEEKKGLFLRVIDDVTEESVEGLRLEVQLPDGSRKKATTDSDGRIEFTSLKEGRVRVTCAADGATLAETVALVKEGILPSAEAEKARRRRPSIKGRYLLRLLTHKVEDGDTLESIAQEHELTADELMKFNFGTTDPKKVQLHLFSELGCTKRDEEGNLVLSSDAEPGLLYIPRPLELDWVALQHRHILRVQKVRGHRIYKFSA